MVEVTIKGMSPGALKGVGIGCFVVCAILLFVAWERYQDNANKVEAMNKMVGGMAGQLMGQLAGGAKLEPGMPDATKYALFFAALTAVGGIACMLMSTKTGATKRSERTTPPSP
jgi:hypothetical protein